MPTNQPISPVVDILTRSAYIKPDDAPIDPDMPEFGGGKGGPPVEPSIGMKDYVDSRDDAIESRLSAKLDKIPTKGTVWGAMATAVGILVAIAAFGADRFDGGVGASSLVREQQAIQKKADEAQDAKIELMNQKLDILIKQTASK